MTGNIPADDEALSPDSSEWAAEAETEADWTGDDLEQAYLKAIAALDQVEADLPPAIVSDPEAFLAADFLPPAITIAVPPLDAAGKQALTDELVALQQERTAEPAKSDSPATAEAAISPRQIVEACLFVGGGPISVKKLCHVLRSDFQPEQVESLLDSLNQQYAAELRPYEIRLDEGGYHLALRPEFERIRQKVYGVGPKEVRLSQEALEVLAVVAYHQPITQARLEELGKPNVGAVLRLLLRRELLTVKREPDQPKQVAYITTPRFLSLFGIGSLDDLPRPEDISFK